MKVGVVFGDGKQIDLETGEIGLHSTPVVVKDVVLVGSAMKEGMTITTHNNTKGLVRAYDARTGKVLWTFNTIPQARRVRQRHAGSTTRGRSTATSACGRRFRSTRSSGSCTCRSRSPTSDYYGGKRPGNNLFAESLVCVDLATGKRKWHFQFVHHPIWNYDMSSAPLLADVTIDGKPRKLVAVPSKQAWLYVFDRVTGEPIWPIEEKPVPKGDVPGEWYSPTQPHPPASLMYGRNTLTEDDLIDFTPELRAQAKKQLERYKWLPGDVYNPPILGNVNGLLGAINMGNANGGTNWPGGGYDPETRTVFAQASMARRSTAESVAPPPPGFSDLPYQAGVVGQPFRLREAAGTGTYADVPRTRPRGAGAGRGGSGSAGRDAASRAGAPPAGRGAAAAAGGGGGESGLTIQGLSIVKPPYGALAAIDLEKGAVKWRVPHGDTPDAVRSHPLLKGMNIPKTGQGGTVGLVITKTLVILGDPQVTTTAAASARRDAARVRQGDRQRGRRGVHAGAAERLADDLHAQRQAVHRRGGERRTVFGRVHRVQPAGRRGHTMTRIGIVAALRRSSRLSSSVARL